MYCVKCVNSICTLRLRVIGHDDGVRISLFDKKHMCGGLKRAREVPRALQQSDKVYHLNDLKLYTRVAWSGRGLYESLNDNKYIVGFEFG